MNPAPLTPVRTARAPKRVVLPDAAIALTTIDFEPCPALLYDDGLRRRWERIVLGDRS